MEMRKQQEAIAKDRRTQAGRRTLNICISSNLQKSVTDHPPSNCDDNA